jgi:peptidoglycan/xylan/chitin deacetylase (PgdA/CDA1 family)
MNDLGFSMGLRKLPITTSGRRMLVYHGVVKNATTAINSRFISSAMFEQHLAYFKEHFNVVSLDEYVSGANDPSKLTVTLTFDDGYLNNLTEALPLLEKYQVPATFYITTIRSAGYDLLWTDALDLYRHTGPSEITLGNTNYRKGKHEYQNAHDSLKSVLKNGDWLLKKELLNLVLTENQFKSNSAFDPYHQLMNEDEIRALSASNFAKIGAHGVYHNCLDAVSPEEAEQELKTAKTYLENVLQKEVDSFAYPDGRYTRGLIDAAERLGYKTQLGVDPLFPEDLSDERLIFRFGVNPYISFNNQIECMVHGKY